MAASISFITRVFEAQRGHSYARESLPLSKPDCAGGGRRRVNPPPWVCLRFWRFGAFITRSTTLHAWRPEVSADYWPGLLPPCCPDSPKWYGITWLLVQGQVRSNGLSLIKRAWHVWLPVCLFVQLVSFGAAQLPVPSVQFEHCSHVSDHL